MNNCHGEDTERKQTNRGWIIWAAVSAFLGYLVWAVIKDPGSINLGSLLPWVLVLACPLMHLMMMRGMGHGQGQHHRGGCCGHSYDSDPDLDAGKPGTKKP